MECVGASPAPKFSVRGFRQTTDGVVFPVAFEVFGKRWRLLAGVLGAFLLLAVRPAADDRWRPEPVIITDPADLDAYLADASGGRFSKVI